jgi:hypothetical protein
MENLKIDVIEKFVELSYDEKMTNELTEIREKVAVSSELFTVNEVIAPRKSFVKRVLDAELEYSKNEVQEDRKSQLRSFIYKLQKNPEQQEINFIEKLLKENRLYIGRRWISLFSSKSPEGEIIPYLVKASVSDKKELLSSPTQYELAELAIICAVYGKNKGIVFKIFPNIENAIQVFNVNFKDMSICLKEVKGILDKLKEVKTKENLTELPPCPFYMNGKRNCPVTEECNEVIGQGCLLRR